jgi:hypothetical protein
MLVVVVVGVLSMFQCIIQDVIMRRTCIKNMKATSSNSLSEQRFYYLKIQSNVVLFCAQSYLTQDFLKKKKSINDFCCISYNNYFSRLIVKKHTNNMMITIFIFSQHLPRVCKVIQYVFLFIKQNSNFP